MEKAFDAVQWMRKRRAEIDEEDRGLTWSEKRQKTHEIVMRDPLLALLCKRIMTPEQVDLMMAKESPSAYGAVKVDDSNEEKGSG
ncbi:MAG: hypothetical protein K6T30_07860 [Alicyclobacillus sp.]|nr:hypothetical protein [Alicyclobacillus sp.]